ncbi:MAG: EamA family transporter [Bacteroidetes bacterium]|nr:EamA family transporter [Bacteroidota bacterium]
MSIHAPSRLKLLVAFAAIYLVWGSTYLAIAFAVESIPPFLAIGTRFLVAGSLLYGFTRLKGVQRPTWQNMKNGALVGVLSLGIGTGFVAWAEQYIDSGFAALIVTMVPLWFVLLDWWWLKGGAPRRPVIIGLILGFIGITVLTGPELVSGIKDSNAVAVLMVIVATMSWSVGSLRSKMISMPKNLFMSSAVQMTAGGVMVSLIGLALGEMQGFSWTAVTDRSLWAWGYLVVFGSLGAFSAYVWLLGHAPPKQISSYAFVNPVVAVFLGWLLADEVVDARILAACVIMVSAVALIVRYGGNRSVTPKKAKD